MSNTILYRCGSKLYLNITNRCPCNCRFCIRNNGDGVNENESLWLEHEPSFDELKCAINNIELNQFDEVVFCGYGEPTEKLDILIETARFIKEKSNIPIRINTNGLSDLINNKKTAALLAAYVDIISISLNAPTKEEYNELCDPIFGEASFDAMLSFALDCKKYITTVYFTIVDVLDDGKIDKCKKLCEELGIQLRIRELIS